MTDEQLALLDGLSRALTPVSDMALLLDIPESVLRMELADRSTPASRVYHLAKAEVSLRLRRHDLELAEAGSPTASEAVSGHFLRMLQDE